MKKIRKNWENIRKRFLKMHFQKRFSYTGEQPIAHSEKQKTDTWAIQTLKIYRYCAKHTKNMLKNIRIRTLTTE